VDKRLEEINPVESVGDAPFRVLVVDDDHTNRLILRAMLLKESYQVTLAENGEEAVRRYNEERHDMVLMDVMMPVMDGYEAARLIKKEAGAEFVPLIFLTAINDDQALARCIEVGGDDFLTKPYNRVILQAKINALRRVRQLYAVLQQQHDALAGHHQRLQREQEIAAAVFSNIVRPGDLKVGNLKYLLSAMAVANGDLVLVARKPSGGQHIMLGDLTGHGLAAAIGAMPVSDLFTRMTEKGFSIVDIVTQLNQRMKDRLPTGLFLAAVLLELDSNHTTLTVWNGGMPDVLIWSDGGIKHRLASSHLPLGVVNSDELENRLEIIEVSLGDRVIAYSDGVIEAIDSGGEMFGQERLEESAARVSDASQLFGEISTALEHFRGGAAQSDDITLVEITCDPQLVAGDYAEHDPHLPFRMPSAWNVSFRMEADALRTIDPLPQLVQLLCEMQGLEEHRTRIYTILAELFSNALEHGVLRLDSKLKENPHGFAEYYQQRELALGRLQDGWVRIHFDHHPRPSEEGDPGGQLRIRIEDSGSGFHFDQQGRPLSENVNRQGRGIALVRTLCSDVRYLGRGNEVEVDYHW
jgi:CheY-like chemotaxis protein